MSTLMDRVPLPVQGLALHAVFALPQPLRRLLAGPPIRRDGLELALDAQLLLRLMSLTDTDLTRGTAAEARAHLEQSRGLVAGPALTGVRTRDLDIPSEGDPVPARLYEPANLPPGSPLLVYLHGGGWVIGSIDSHDPTCRYLARNAQVRVLSVGYRLAPEHCFPAAAEDAFTAFRFAAHNAEKLGADPSAIAVGGDSAGANLAASICLQAMRKGPRPVFQLLFYPATDMTTRRRSRDVFGEGFFLTDDDMTWYLDHYCPDVDQRHDPRLSVLLADDLRGLPPAYVATAGFDPAAGRGQRVRRPVAGRRGARGETAARRPHTRIRQFSEPRHAISGGGLGGCRRVAHWARAPLTRERGRHFPADRVSNSGPR